MDEGCQGRQRRGVSDAEVADLSETRYGMLSLRALLQEQEQWPYSQSLQQSAQMIFLMLSPEYPHFSLLRLLTQAHVNHHNDVRGLCANLFSYNHNDDLIPRMTTSLGQYPPPQSCARHGGTLSSESGRALFESPCHVWARLLTCTGDCSGCRLHQ